MKYLIPITNPDGAFEALSAQEWARRGHFMPGTNEVRPLWE